MAPKNTRRVKLHSKYRATGGPWHPQYKAIPWLNVSGVWLEQAGFKVGHQVQITVEDNQLIIKNLSAHGATSH